MGGNRRVVVGAALGIAAAGMASGLASCSKDEEQVSSAVAPSSVVTAEPSAAATAAASGDQGDTELDAIAMPSPQECVRKCIERNQMRAVAPEQISADCTRDCRKSCLARCDAVAVGRAPHFGEECRKDCARQIGSGVE